MNIIEEAEGTERYRKRVRDALASSVYGVPIDSLKHDTDALLACLSIMFDQYEAAVEAHESTLNMMNAFNAAHARKRA